MSDPLSVAAGVAGVVTAAAQISSLLIKFTKSTIRAPQQVKVVLAEVSDIGGILSHLQSFLLGLDAADRSRTALLKVEKVVTLVSGCVLTFSELEKLLDQLKTEDLGLLDSLKWARKESAIVGLIQRLQNHKASLSLVLDILNGHTIAEARDSVDRLNAIVEKYYKEMSSRVQALEVLHTQKDDASWVSEDETESLATIRAARLDLSSEDMSSGLEYFDFSDELQRSRVYRRNQAFRKSVISALTNSVCSLGWSFFSDLSMAEVSNASVINLAVTKGEVFNPGRSLQAWSAQPNSGVSSDDYVDGQCTQLYELTDRPVQRSASLANVGESRPASTQIQRRSLPGTRSPSPRSQQLERRNNYPFWKETFGDKESTKIGGNLSPTSTLSSADPWDPSSWSTQVKATSSSRFHDLVDNGCGEAHFTLPMSPNQVQATSTQFHGWVEDEEEYPCKGCGEILEEEQVFELDGNTWHIDCFRCSTCGTILDSDAYILVLGDGSPICYDCTFSCSVCNTKTEDVAILTEDKAFCAICFKCRNCKKSIENLKYARTAQGIFCMNCHAKKASNRPYEAIQEPRGTVSKAITLASALTDSKTPNGPSMILPFDHDINGEIHNQTQDKDSISNAEKLESTSTLSPVASLVPLPLEAQAISSPQSHEWVRVEDLFGFSHDQNFCVVSFKCRSCKKKIENLEYARTSKGILCQKCYGMLTHRSVGDATRMSRIAAISGAHGISCKECHEWAEQEQELRDTVSNSTTLTTVEQAEWERLAGPSVIFPFEQYVKKDNHKQDSPEYFF